MNRRHRIILVLILALCLSAAAFVGCSNAPDTPDWQHQFDLGMRYLSQGNYQEAILAFRAAIEIDPRRVDAHLGLANAHIGLGDIPAARAALREGYNLTGDERLRDRLEELEEDDTLRDDEAGTEETVQEPHVIQGTSAQRAFLDRVCDAMLAGNYEYALKLMESSEMYDILTEHGSFVYREIFMFSGHSSSWDDSFLRLVAADKTQNGSGLVVHVTAFSGGSDHSHLTIMEHRDGVQNGRHETRDFAAPGGQMQWVDTAWSSNGLRHGEAITNFVQHGVVYTYNWENGFYVVLGPPNEDGNVPVGVFVDPMHPDGGGFSYRRPDGFGFTEPFTHPNLTFEHWLNPLMPRFE